MLLQHCQGLVRSVSLGDSTNIEFHAADAQVNRPCLAIQQDILIAHASPRFRQQPPLRQPLRVARFPPQGYQGSHTDVKRAIGDTREAQRPVQHGKQIAAHRDRSVRGFPAQTHELAFRIVIRQHLVKVLDALECGSGRPARKVLGIRIKYDLNPRTHLDAEILEPLQSRGVCDANTDRESQ